MASAPISSPPVGMATRWQVGELALVAAAERRAQRGLAAIERRLQRVERFLEIARHAVRIAGDALEHARLRRHRVDPAHAGLERVEHRVDRAAGARRDADAAVGGEAVDQRLRGGARAFGEVGVDEDRTGAGPAAGSALHADVFAVVRPISVASCTPRGVSEPPAGSSGHGCAVQLRSPRAHRRRATPWRLTTTSFCSTSSPCAAPAAAARTANMAAQETTISGCFCRTFVLRPQPRAAAWRRRHHRQQRQRDLEDPTRGGARSPGRRSAPMRVSSIPPSGIRTAAAGPDKRSGRPRLARPRPSHRGWRRRRRTSGQRCAWGEA